MTHTGIILGKIICESSKWQQHKDWRSLFWVQIGNFLRSERMAKCSYFIWSTQNIKFYWIVMKIKKFVLSIWLKNRGLFPLGNKYFGVFVLNGLRIPQLNPTITLFTHHQSRQPFKNIKPTNLIPISYVVMVCL